MWGGWGAFCALEAWAPLGSHFSQANNALRKRRNDELEGKMITLATLENIPGCPAVPNTTSPGRRTLPWGVGRCRLRMAFEIHTRLCCAEPMRSLLLR